MSPTLLFLGFVLVSHFIQWVAWGICLAIGLKWAGATDVTITPRKITVTTVAVHVGQIVLFAFMGACLWYEKHIPLVLLVPLVIACMSGVLLVPIALVGRNFGLSFLRSIQSLIPTLLVLALGYGIAAGVMKPFLWEAFVGEANSMAPTLRGKHWRQTCPQCGSPTVCSPREPHAFGPSDEPLMICEQFHVLPFTGDPLAQTVHPADRMMVAKFLTPKRWDLIAFRVPANPTEIYVKRLVGLPGETIVIKDGSVWADGKRLTPPAELKNIVYLDKMPDGFGPSLWGTEDNPAKLGEGEFFVLGDFSISSSDSRWWQASSGDHPAYALPQANIVGVVTLIYWPPSRWREF